MYEEFIFIFYLVFFFVFVKDSVAGRIIQTTKQQYLANNIPLSRFVTIGIDVCPSVSVKKFLIDFLK
jgi:hypothetical protein